MLHTVTKHAWCPATCKLTSGDQADQPGMQAVACLSSQMKSEGVVTARFMECRCWVDAEMSGSPACLNESRTCPVSKFVTLHALQDLLEKLQFRLTAVRMCIVGCGSSFWQLPELKNNQGVRETQHRQRRPSDIRLMQHTVCKRSCFSQ